jgi:hypothetical protein
MYSQRRLNFESTSLFTEAAPPLLIRSDNSQQVNLAKLRPVNIQKDELAVRALPQQKSAESFLSGSS